MSLRKARLARIASAAVKGASALAIGACLTIGGGIGVAHAATRPTR